MIPFTFSGKVLDFSLPTAWEMLTQEQLRYVCYAITHFEGVNAKTYMFIRLLGIQVYRKIPSGWVCNVRSASGKKVWFYLREWQIMYFLKQLDFVDMPGQVPVCLLQIGDLSAVDVRLRGVSFADYIKAENYYQGFLRTNDNLQLMAMAKILYTDKEGKSPDDIRFSDSELLSVFLWFASVKNYFASCFPFFFSRSSGNGDTDDVPDMIAVMNAEIRALTAGDITKENDVLSMDCWRALTELNEKARETKEWNEKYGRK